MIDLAVWAKDDQTHEERKKRKKMYKFHWKTNLVCNISGIETYARKMRFAIETSMIQRYCTYKDTYMTKKPEIHPEPPLGRDPGLGLYLQDAMSKAYVELGNVNWESKDNEDFKWPMKFRRRGNPTWPEPKRVDRDPFWGIKLPPKLSDED